MNTVESLDAILCELADVANEIERYAQNPQSLPVSSTPVAEDQAELAVVAARLLDELFARADFFPGFAVSEPSWLILLDLYICAVAGRSVMMGEACLAARVPNTTALRYVAALVAQGVVARGSDPLDRRRTLLSLTEDGFAAMSNYLAKVAGLRNWGGRYGDAGAQRTPINGRSGGQRLRGIRDRYSLQIASVTGR